MRVTDPIQPCAFSPEKEKETAVGLVRKLAGVGYGRPGFVETSSSYRCHRCLVQKWVDGLIPLLCSFVYIQGEKKSVPTVAANACKTYTLNVE